MAWEQNPYAVKISLVANGDLSSSQYKFVKLDGNVLTGTPSCVVATAATDYCIGILQNQPKSVTSGGFTNYGEAEVTISGITKVVAGATNIAIGARLSVDSSGRAVPVTAAAATTNSKYIFGTALTASGSSGATGDIITMVVSTTAAVLSA